MKIKRFVAKDMRSALAEVKEFLGPDAIILSNKKVAEGVEIVAAIDAEPAASSKPAANARVEDITPLTKRAEPKVNIRIDDQAEAEPADSLRALLARQMLKQQSRELASANAKPAAATDPSAGQAPAAAVAVGRRLDDVAERARPREHRHRPSALRDVLPGQRPAAD